MGGKDGRQLFYGDNLDVLRRHIADESVDLIHLDPPFKSAKDYNLLFTEQDGTRAEAQVKAFKDTWEWDETAVNVYHELVEGGGKLSESMQAFRLVVGESDMLAYLSMMAPRLVELHRVLKPTGSIYLHCDPVASHYLRSCSTRSFSPAISATRPSGATAAGQRPRASSSRCTTCCSSTARAGRGSARSTCSTATRSWRPRR